MAASRRWRFSAFRSDLMTEALRRRSPAARSAPSRNGSTDARGTWRHTLCMASDAVLSEVAELQAWTMCCCIFEQITKHLALRLSMRLNPDGTTAYMPTHTHLLS